MSDKRIRMSKEQPGMQLSARKRRQDYEGLTNLLCIKTMAWQVEYEGREYTVTNTTWTKQAKMSYRTP